MAKEIDRSAVDALAASIGEHLVDKTRQVKAVKGDTSENPELVRSTSSQFSITLAQAEDLAKQHAGLEKPVLKAVADWERLKANAGMVLSGKKLQDEIAARKSDGDDDIATTLRATVVIPGQDGRLEVTTFAQKRHRNPRTGEPIIVYGDTDVHKVVDNLADQAIGESVMADIAKALG